ncbi:MAG: hypothetical protein LBS59_04705 [Puniceicoccales bacterium]|jgi:hypothetical protein|nr:hypothetical protein [Puniceicoccales bacterium]
MKKLTITAFLAAAVVLGGIATDTSVVTTAQGAPAAEKKISAITIKARETKASYEAYRARKKGYGNLNKRWFQYIAEAKTAIPPIIAQIDVVGKEDLGAAMHAAWVYDELLDKGEEPVKGADVSKILEKYDFNRFVAKHATEKELNAVSAKKTKQYLGAFKAAADRLGEDSVWEKAQERAKSAE